MTAQPIPQPKLRPHVLCVDDEPNVLEGLSLSLRRHYHVATATSGAEGLDLLRADRSIVVVVSDMRMPGMDGATFLHRARLLLPDSSRILLTGQADLDSAIAAVNDGKIFRFLSKPCPSEALLAALEAAAEQHRLVTSERVLLEQTLHGSIKTLIEVLSLTNPVSFGRANRIKKVAADLAARLELPDRWQIEVAAMLSQLGYITLPGETMEKLYYGQPLSDPEQTMVGRVPQITDQLLANIPRLETVREILAHATRPRRPPPADPKQARAERAADVLRLALEFDALESPEHPPAMVLETLRGRGGHDPAHLVALAELHGVVMHDEVRELALADLRVGMVLAEDLKLKVGTLLLTRGFEINESFLARASNFRPGSVREPIRVIVKAELAVTP